MTRSPSIRTWEQAYQRFETPEQERAKFIKRLRQLGVEKWDRSVYIAELFCGRGNGLHAWNSLGFGNLHGLDLSEDLVAAYTGPSPCTVGDARDLPFDDATFNAVAIQGGLHHLVMMDDLHQTLAEIHRVLKPDGKLLLVEPWLTPFLSIVHGMCRSAMLRRAWGKLDALATMIEHERETYEDWLSKPQEITQAIDRVCHTEIRRVGWGKLIYLGTRR